MSKYKEAITNLKREIETPYFSSLYDFDDYKHDWEVIQEAIEKAEKYDGLTSGVLWKNGQTRTAWFNKIRNQEQWLDLLAHCNDEADYLRLIQHLDRQVLLWGLYALKDEIKRYSEVYNK